MRYFRTLSPEKHSRLAYAVLLALLLAPTALPQNGGGTLGKVEIKNRPPTFAKIVKP